MQSASASPAAAVVEEPAASPALTVTVERTCEGLAAHVSAWEELAARAADPNPFYEPHALLAAFEHLPEAQRAEVVLVWAANPLPKQPPFLVGLFPLIRHVRFKGLPLPTISTWKHLYSYLGTPLVRADRAAETLDAFLGWLRDDAGAALFIWNTIASDTGFRHALTDALNRHRLHVFEDERHTRAIFRPATNAEAYLDRALAGKKQKELRRQLRRLSEIEPVTFDAIGSDLEPWLDQFLALEGRGWKGGGGTAMKDDPPARELFRATLRGAHARGRLDAWTMRLPSKPLPLAMKCNLRAGSGALAFKIAYDEDFAKYSPGVLLEMEHIAWMHSPGAPAWIDSGAAAQHPMINHLWRDRLGIETLVMPIGSRASAFTVAALPLVRLARSAISRLRSSNPTKP